jgi:hypothetical protein
MSQLNSRMVGRLAWGSMTLETGGGDGGENGLSLREPLLLLKPFGDFISAQTLPLLRIHALAEVPCILHIKKSPRGGLWIKLALAAQGTNACAAAPGMLS